jgi:hypothetical protein
MQTHSRRSFIAAGSISLAGGAAIASGFATGDQSESEDHAPVRTTTDRVRAFVGASHAQIDKVQEMLDVDPDLAKASWDWGFGDFETAIGACSHTGRKDIIELLLEHGARPTIFTLATLDKIAAVRGFIESMPGARDIEGPHSISLYRHAQAGKATRVMEYLEKAGLGSGPNLFKTDQDEVSPYVGVYSAGLKSEFGFEIKWSERWGCLSIETQAMASRNLMPLKDQQQAETGPIFRPAGSRGARVTFPSPQLLVVKHGGQTWNGRRVDG